MPGAVKLPPLVRRRVVWLPTLWGWVLILGAGAGAVLLFGTNLYSFLALNSPVGAPLLVVEGWMHQDALDQAAATYRSRGYERILTTGGPIDNWPRTHASYAERAADYFRKSGIPPSAVVALPPPWSPGERTYQSAVAVREWSRQAGLRLSAIDVFSEGTHARRSRMLFRLAFGPDVAVGVLAAPPDGYEAARWWETSLGARDVLDQAIGLLWVTLFFWPPGA